ncbi:MAG: rRNA maturation RNase YbeY [Cyclonatronaceae bacterium]
MGSFQVFNDSGMEVSFDETHLERLISVLNIGEKRNFELIEVVFLNSDAILKINREYLGHDYVTDIITFPYHKAGNGIEGTLYCCAAQIKSQSNEFNVSFESEVLRVVVHGLLHLIGYNDRTGQERQHMHQLENKYMTLFNEV